MAAVLQDDIVMHPVMRRTVRDVKKGRQQASCVPEVISMCTLCTRSLSSSAVISPSCSSELLSRACRDESLQLVSSDAKLLACDARCRVRRMCRPPHKSRSWPLTFCFVLYLRWLARLLCLLDWCIGSGGMAREGRRSSCGDAERTDDGSQSCSHVGHKFERQQRPARMLQASGVQGRRR